MALSSISEIILQNFPQTRPRTLERSGDGRDGDTVQFRDLPHGHRILIVAQQIAALAVGQLGVPCLPHKPQQELTLFLFAFGKECLVRAARKPAHDIRIECKRICRDAPCPAQRAGDQCTSFAA